MVSSVFLLNFSGDRHSDLTRAAGAAGAFALMWLFGYTLDNLSLLL